MTATQMATPSDQALSSRCSLTAVPSTVEICKEVLSASAPKTTCERANTRRTTGVAPEKAHQGRRHQQDERGVFQVGDEQAEKRLQRDRLKPVQGYGGEVLLP